MVVFTCGYCGESVQKPKVEKHYMTKCRNRNPNLSCMDCFKDFLGNSYNEHTKCITEEERYSGKGFVAKEKKGEKKQSTWIDLVQSVLDEQKNAPKNVLRIIETISKHNNTPRKKPKFYNFVKNVCGAKTGAKDIEQAWELISPKLAALSNANQRNQNQEQKNGDDTTNGDTLENGHNNADNQDETSQDKENSQDVPSVDKKLSKKQRKEKKQPKSETVIPNGTKENGHNDSNNQDDTSQDGQNTENRDSENSQDVPTVENKLSKKQRKEEKKRQKYEAELQSAEAILEEETEEIEGKKGKKKKNRTESLNGENEPHEGKKNKRKRQDTVNSVTSNQEVSENGTEIVANRTAKTQKKKPKVDVEEEAEESMCLHDQNVAKISELAVNDKFNWHAVILSLLQKKGNELPFKRLQKKVLGEYSEMTGREVDDRIADKFIKKLKSAPNVRVDKNRVTLID